MVLRGTHLPPVHQQPLSTAAFGGGSHLPARCGNAQNADVAGAWEGLAVDDHVFHTGLFPVHAAQGLTHAVDADIPQHKAGDGYLREGLQKDAVVPAVRSDVLDGDVPEYRQVGAVPAILIEHCAVDGCTVDGFHHAVAEHYLLHPAAPAGVGLEPQGVGQVRAGKMVLAGKDAADAAAHLAAQRNAAVAVRKLVVLNEHILAGDIGQPAVPVPTGFQADAVVPGIKAAVFDPDTRTAFGVAAVIVGTVAGKGQPIHDDAAALHRVQLPHGAVVQRHPLQQHPLAAQKLHKIRAEEMPPAKDALCHRNPLLVHPAQGFAGGKLQVRLICRPRILYLMMPVPPVIFVCSAVQRTAAGHGNVMGIPGIEQGTVIVAGAGLPVGEHQRIVPFRLLRGKGQQGLGRSQMQLHTAFQVQCPGAVDARREHQHPAACGAQCVNGGLQPLRLQAFGIRHGFGLVWPNAGRLDLR